MRKKTTIWIILLILPIPILLFTAALQIINAFVFSTVDGGGGSKVIDIVALLLGVAAVLVLICFPIWVYMLIRAKTHNDKLKSSHEIAN